MARWRLIPERMVARWEGLRVGKDAPCRVPPLLESARWLLLDLLVHGRLDPEITDAGMCTYQWQIWIQFSIMKNHRRLKQCLENHFLQR